MSGATTIFVTDADNRELLDYDGSTGAILRWYAYGPGPNAVLSQMNVVAATRDALLPDPLGSIVASVDSPSGTISKASYQPFGLAAAPPAQFGFTAQRIDPESGLYYYRARHYSPEWGRFAQPDPIGYRGGANLYAYVYNDPLNLLDPEGLSARKAIEATASVAQDAGSRANAFVNGAYSVIPGVGNAFEALYRGTGLAGREEYRHFGQETELIGMAFTKAVEYPRETFRVAAEITQIADRENPLLRYYVAGRLSFGAITRLGPAATAGDLLAGVQRGREPIEALMYSIGGLRP